MISLFLAKTVFGHDCSQYYDSESCWEQSGHQCNWHSDCKPNSSYCNHYYDADSCSNVHGCIWNLSDGCVSQNSCRDVLSRCSEEQCQATGQCHWEAWCGPYDGSLQAQPCRRRASGLGSGSGLGDASGSGLGDADRLGDDLVEDIHIDNYAARRRQASLDAQRVDKVFWWQGDVYISEYTTLDSQEVTRQGCISESSPPKSRLPSTCIELDQADIPIFAMQQAAYNIIGSHEEYERKDYKKFEFVHGSVRFTTYASKWVNPRFSTFALVCLEKDSLSSTFTDLDNRNGAKKTCIFKRI